MTTHRAVDVGVAKQIGAYSDAIETAPNLRWLYTAGTPGLSRDGISGGSGSDRGDVSGQRGARLARMRCKVRRCMLSRRAVSDTLRPHNS